MEYYIIENDVEKVRFYNNIGIGIIMVDLEVLGKEDRQKNLDTVKSKHTLDDIRRIRPIVDRSELCVRIDPIHAKSAEQIEKVIACGVDSIMLPFFKTFDEVEIFFGTVASRVKTVLLFETPEAIMNHEEILSGIRPDRIHIGLNDLSLALKNGFMFKSLILNTLGTFCDYLVQQKIPFGIGGIASLEGGKIPGRLILGEYVRLGARYTIISRSFVRDNEGETFQNRVHFLKLFAGRLKGESCDYFSDNRKELLIKLRSLK